MDPRIALAWLMSEPSTTLKCFACQNRFGPITVRVGLNLTVEFDVEELESVVVPRAYAFLEKHHCEMVESEYRMLFDQATKWAEENFDRFVRNYKEREQLTESAVSVINATTT